MLSRLTDILRRLVLSHSAWPVVLVVSLLCTASVLAIGATSMAERAKSQQFNIAVGIVVLVLVLLPHYQWFGQVAYALMGVAAGLLALVLTTPAINGAHRWFALKWLGAVGLGGFQLQPSEFAKIAFVLSLAWYLRYRKNVRDLSGLLGPFLVTLVPCGLIMVEPDLGTAMLFPIVLYCMLIAAGARLRHLVLIAFLAAVILPGSYPLMPRYAQLRIIAVAGRVMGQQGERQLRGPGWQGHVSMTAIGSGGATGHGVDSTNLIRHGLLPEAHTDCIYAVIGSQWGFVGCAAVVLMYLAFVAAALEIAAAQKDPFPRLAAVGLTSLIVAQAFINIAMTTGLGPVVGIALPFISYGGSSMITNMIAAGILLNISVRRSNTGKVVALTEYARA